MQRCKGTQKSIAARKIENQKLNLHQELELVEYINDLTKKGLPPTREMTRKFGEEIAHEHVGDG
ncbi:hypothetical protein EK21DRAFT_62320 [Setomelanomma holmii]|uniref:HTH CENPB-type domain-containing protein n=1 Tax=Setomelanomma holmii TaxID=210430 RepID=A0A9P4HCP8_9PLEO|nr:hypothetical protein EK21DRAFT_62320 [Setomelanomma holmii]